MNLLELYNADDRFKEYVDKYTTQRNVTLDVAFSHKQVHLVAEYYLANKGVDL